MSKSTIGTGHPKVTCNVSGLNKPKVDWVTNTWSDAAREAAVEARRAQGGGDAGDAESLSQHAEQTSAAASNASKAASAQPSQQAHQDAAHAHEDAAEAHGKAAIRQGAEGNDTMQKYHQGVAQGHEAKADEHAGKAEAAAGAKGGAESSKFVPPSRPAKSKYPDPVAKAARQSIARHDRVMGAVQKARRGY